MPTLHLDFHRGRAKAHWLGYIIFGKVNLLAILKTYEIQFESRGLFGQREYKGLFPGEIFGLWGSLAIAFLIVIGQPAVGQYVLIDILELGLPEGYN